MYIEKLFFIILCAIISLCVLGCKMNAFEDKKIVTENKIMVKSILSEQSKTVNVSREDALVINEILEKGEWNNEGTAECINNCTISIDDTLIYYHSECGTFNDKINGRNLSLYNETRIMINSMFEKYISLDTTEK